MTADAAPGAVPTLERDGHVFLLDLGGGENRFNADWLAAVEAHLDEVQAAPAPRALVTKATGKFWSNGLDLEWMAADPDLLQDFLLRVHELLARVLALDAPAVAALQGHTFAAGAMAAQRRALRSQRCRTTRGTCGSVPLRAPTSEWTR
jgi:enoyl-CoA hydratase/carnithine racemase